MARKTPTVSLAVLDRGGRPVILDDTLRDRLLDHLARGEFLDEACRNVGISRATAHLHLQRDPDFRQACELARLDGAAALSEKACRLAEQAINAPSLAAVARIAARVKDMQRKADRHAPQRRASPRPATAAPEGAGLSARLAFLARLEVEKPGG